MLEYVVQAQATLDLTVLGATLHGRFGFQQTRKADGSKVLIVAADQVGVTSVGSSTLPAEVVNAVQNARGTLVITNTGMAGVLQFKAAVDVGAFSANADLKISFNNTTQAINVTGPFGAVVLDAGPFIQIDISNLNLVFPGVFITGDFSLRSNTGSACTSRCDR